MEISPALSTQSRGPKPAPRQCDWDLFVERKESTVNIETLLGFSRGIRVFTKEFQAIVQEKKSFILQDPTKDTWGTMVNKDLAKIFEKKGPQAYHWDKEIAAEPPNWTETILALRSDKFGLAQDEDGGNHYKGYVRAYRVILTEAEYRRLEGYCTSDIPTRSDLSCELEETKKMLKVITDTKLSIKDLARLETALIARIQEFNEIMKPELGSLFPKEALPPKRPFEYDPTDQEAEVTRRQAARRIISRRTESSAESPADSESEDETTELQDAEGNNDANRPSAYSPALTPRSSRPGVTLHRVTVQERTSDADYWSSLEFLKQSTRDKHFPPEFRSANLNNTRGSTPRSTPKHGVFRSPEELQLGQAFIKDCLEDLADFSKEDQWKKLIPMYRARFNVWRTVSALRKNRLYGSWIG